MNNCSLVDDVIPWAREQLTRPGVTRVGHYAPFDLRMLKYVGIDVAGVEDTCVAAAILDENRPSFGLNDLAARYGLGTKSDDAMHLWMVQTIPELRGKKATRKICAPWYWRVPHAQMDAYARQDAVLTLGLYDKMRPEVTAGDRHGSLDAIYQLETDLLPLLLQMHMTGVRVDLPRAHRLVIDLTAQLDDLARDWRRDYGDANFRSADDLKPILDQLGVAYPLTPKTGKPSITKKFLDDLDHPIGDRIRELRQLGHYRDTFVKSYVIDNCTEERDVIHGEFHALRRDGAGTVSGRFSSGGALNLQNIPARDEKWAPIIRSLFRPMTDDQQWLKVDYSQIEYRFFAHYGGVRASRLGVDSAMERAYVDEPHVDFHQWVADTAHIPRRRAKNVNFCRLYGGGIGKIAETAGCTIEEATEFVSAYDQYVPEAKALLKELESVADRRGVIITWAGRRCRFPTNGQLAARWGGGQPQGHADKYARTYKALNALLQGSAADLNKRGMVALHKAGLTHHEDGTQLHLTVHDELDFSIPKGDAGTRRTSQIVEIMQDVGRLPSWDGRVMKVPVVAESTVGPNWGMTP